MSTPTFAQSFNDNLSTIGAPKEGAILTHQRADGRHFAYVTDDDGQRRQVTGPTAEVIETKFRARGPEWADWLDALHGAGILWDPSGHAHDESVTD